MKRVLVNLSKAEFRGLRALAQSELRPVPDELRHLLRCELLRRGLLVGENLAPSVGAAGFCAVNGSKCPTNFCAASVDWENCELRCKTPRITSPTPKADQAAIETPPEVES
jgi:hypothetical protein